MYIFLAHAPLLLVHYLSWPSGAPSTPPDPCPPDSAELAWSFGPTVVAGTPPGQAPPLNPLLEKSFNQDGQTDIGFVRHSQRCFSNLEFPAVVSSMWYAGLSAKKITRKDLLYNHWKMCRNVSVWLFFVLFFLPNLPFSVLIWSVSKSDVALVSL